LDKPIASPAVPTRYSLGALAVNGADT